MTRRPLIALLALAVALVAAGSAQAAPLLTEAGDATFPFRSYVLGVPEGTPVADGAVTVIENGVRVPSVSVQPARAGGGRDLGVVLAIDASRSMRGAPIRAAMAAARTFAERRSPQQPLAVVTFDDRASVLLPFTRDPARIARALATPPALGRSTHIYDGAAEALRLLRDARISAGSVVVLSDGADTGSRNGAEHVAREAHRVGARVFSVGLGSGASGASVLRELSRAAGGSFTRAATPRDLEPIYDGLASRLASEYLVRYRSSAPPGRQVSVFVRVAGVPGAAHTGYLTPRGSRLPGAAPLDRSLAERFWRSTWAIVAIAAIFALAIGLLVTAALRPSGKELRTRLARFVSLPEQPARREGTALSQRLLRSVERSLSAAAWWTRLERDLELAEIETPALRLVAGTAVATLAALVLIALAIPVLVPLALGVPLGVRAFVQARVRRQRARFADQLAENLQVIASAMRAGHSLSSSLSVVVAEAAEPSKREFRRAVADEQLGVPLDDALQVVADRMDNRDLEQVGMVAALQRDTGGNTAEVLDRVAENLRARAELRRLVKTLTVQGRMSRWIVSALPVVLLVLITVMNRDYMEPLYQSTVGNVLLGVAALMIVTGSLVIRKIVDIEV